MNDDQWACFEYLNRRNLGCVRFEGVWCWRDDFRHDAALASRFVAWLKQNPENEVALMSDVVKIRAVVYKHRHERKLIGFEVVDAPPHVIAHITDEEFFSMDVVANLLRFGYEVQFTPLVEEVSMDKLFIEQDVTEAREQDEVGP